MRDLKTTRYQTWPAVLIAALLLLAACVPAQFPTAAVPPTGGTPAATVSPQPGVTPAEDEEDGSTIPQTGETGEQIPPSDDLERFPESRPPDSARITIPGEVVTPGREMVVQGIGFAANSTVLIFAGRPDVGAEKEPITSAEVDEQGRFTAHTVLPAELPADAVTAGQLLIVAAGEDEQVLAQVVVQTGQAPSGGVETGQPAEPEDEMDFSQLGFDFESVVLPQLNQALGSDLSMDDLNITRLEPRRWPNGCLGLGAEGEFCSQQIVPGFRFLVDVDGQSYEVRTNESGSQVRVNSDLE